MSSSEVLTLAGIELNPEFPFMNAPGSVNGANEERFRSDFLDIVRSPGTIAMIGSVTPPFKEGNEAIYGGPVYRHIKETGLTYNSMGLPNLGIRRFSQILPELRMLAHDHNKKLGISLAPLTSNPAEEWIMMTEIALETGVDFIEFNAGCPNIYDSEGKPKTVLSLVPDTMGEALWLVQNRLGSDFASGVKLSPTPVSDFNPKESTVLDTSLIEHQANVINALSIVKYVAYFNTFGGQVPVDAEGNELPLSVPGGAGGVSGPGIAHIAEFQTDIMLEHLRDDMDVVVAGGINSGQELNNRIKRDERIKLGSSVTALWEARSLGQGAVRLAQEYSNAA